MLLMKKIFFDAIQAGSKTTTLRFWLRRHVRPNSVHLIPGLGRVQIGKVTPVRQSDLTDTDAQADGFECTADLKKALAKLYPPSQRKGRRLYQVHFELLAPTH